MFPLENLNLDEESKNVCIQKTKNIDDVWNNVDCKTVFNENEETGYKNAEC
jgi:hypothetical protein